MLFALQAPPLPLVPQPASVRREAGALRLDRPLTLVGDKGEAQTLAEGLKGDGVAVGKGGRKVALSLVPSMAAEGYRLRVTPDGATIEATTEAGLFYGGQTLRQLVVRAEIPAVTIEDAPRFVWRGMLLDVSRHFRPVADVERLIDLNARMKMNVFHWHLTDDGGWRMESKAYPELTRRGAWRSSPTKGHWNYESITFPERHSEDEYGGFYTQKEIKEVVAFAAKRHVTVVPEIEMPGHEQAALQTFPWLKCDAVPDGEQAVALCAGKPTTFEFVRKILDETMALFPSKWIHVGGDEVDKRDWRRCPQCQARMRREGLKSPEELQSAFIRQVDAYLASKGRRMVGWDEILEGGLAPGATVMSWRGTAGGIAAAKQGRDVVMTPTSHLYLDYKYETISTERVYSYDPIPTELTPEEGKRVLGAQGNVWTEWLPDEKDVERMVYPRAAALAEVGWTPLAQKSWPDFSGRLNVLLATWDRLGVGYRADGPTILHTAYLTDEPVDADWPAPRQGWNLRFDRRKGDQFFHIVGDSGMMEPHRRKLEPGESESFAYVDRAGVETPEVTVRVSRGERRETTDGLQAGLVATSVRGSFERVGDFSGPAGSVVNAIDLATKPAPEKFAMRFTGYIRLPKDGDYTFTLRSDDGSRLTIGGLVVVDNDGEHAAAPKSGTVWAKAGVYPLDLGYFDAGGANSLSLTVKGPDGVEVPVPADWLWH